MQCPSCGSDNADGSQFCTKCGNALTAPAAAPAPTYAPPPAAPAPGYAPPPGAAPAYGQPAYAGTATAVAPKKKRGCVIAAVILAVLLLCCCGSSAAAYFGFVSLGKPRDLGVRYTQKNYDSATQKLGVDVSKAGPDSPTARGEGDSSSSGGEGVPLPPEQSGGTASGSGGGTTGGGTTGGTTGGGTTGGTKGGTTGGGTAAGGATAGPGSKPGGTTGGGTTGSGVAAQGEAAGTVVIYEGSVPVDVEITNEEFSALISLNHYSPNWLVKDMQVVFGDGGTVQMSGYIDYQGQRYPVYVAGTAQLVGPRSFGGEATAVSVAGWDVPADYHSFAAEFLAGLMNDWLGQMEGLNLESVEFQNGMVHIVGSVPAEVIRVPAGQ